MNIYEKLEQEIFEASIRVHRYDLGNDKSGEPLKGLYLDGNIALDVSLENSIEKASVLAEELGHYHMTVGDILDQSKTENRKQEFKARVWAYNKQIGLLGIVGAYEYGCRNLYEMAEYLEVTEDFLKEALSYYSVRYSTGKAVDNYAIRFNPTLGVSKIISDRFN